MDFIALIILTLQITNASAKKKHRYLSDESSIENLLFYQDCKHNPKTPPPVLRAAEPQKPICPCPRMCCSMCCDCNGNDQPSIGRNSISMMSGLMQSPAQPTHPLQPVQNPGNQVLPILPKHRRNRLRSPFSTRRLAGFTKDDIKKLVSKDDDIKKILKDLVTVTMQKVDLEGMLNMKKSAEEQDPGEMNEGSDKDSSDEDDLE